MIFSSFEFLFFFAVIFAAYWALPRMGMRHLFLLVGSYYFYMSWNPLFISLIILSTLVDYGVGRLLEHENRPRRRKTYLIASCTTNLGLLGVFKYANFFVENAAASLRAVGLDVDPVVLNIILPVGISFYTFQTMSYTIDVYRRVIPTERSFIDFALFVAFFPQLVAGPIVRARDFIPQLKSKRRMRVEDLTVGLRIFAQGYFKKCFISDRISPFADRVFANPTGYDTGGVWLGVVLYAVQIYCDFSGYSDMAIGCARTLGFELPVNFRMPYFSRNITEFWRRWHISLSTWLRDYLYIPLGGNRGSKWFQRRNLMLTMLLGGLWHGASWNFVVWGGLHGLYLGVHKWFVERVGGPGHQPSGARALVGGIVSGLLTFVLVCVTWVFFRAQTFEIAGIMIQKMFLFTGGVGDVSPWLFAVIGVVLLAHIAAVTLDLDRLWRRTPLFLKTVACATFLLLVVLFTPFDPQPFIYFQF